MKYNYITIEREYASGGSEIGEKTAAELGIECYGQEVLNIAADKLGISPERIADLEEKATGSLLYSIHLLASINAGEAAGLTHNQQLHIFETRIINELALKGPCVFVGRCAGYALKERDDVLNIFIHSGWDNRKERAIKEYGIPEDRVEEVLKKMDKRRSGYFKATTRHEWDERENCQMILDSGKLGIDGCVRAIVSNVQAGK